MKAHLKIEMSSEVVNELSGVGLDRFANAPTIIEADEPDMDSFIRIFEEDYEEDGMDSFIRIFKD